MKKIFIKAIGLLVFLSFSLVFAQESQEPKSSEAKEPTLGGSIVDEKGHRFIELKGAFPLHPYLTSHGLVQSTVIAFSETMGSVASLGKEHDSIEPKLATDLNITFYPLVEMSQLGFIFGYALDKWKYPVKENGDAKNKYYSMNFAYGGIHGEYMHHVFNNSGTHISLDGEFVIGWLLSDDAGDSKNLFCIDICPFGIQFCPEKHIGLYIEVPHLGARPVLQTGLSIGL